MFYKNAIFYSLTQALSVDVEAVEQQLGELPAHAPGAQDFSTLGFVPVIPGTSLLCLVTGDWLTFKLCREERILPASAINDALEREVAQVEAETGNYVSKKSRADIKSALVNKMLPTSHTKKSYISGAINTAKNLVVVDGTHGKSETWLAMVRKAFGSLPVVPMFRFSLQDALTHWLKDTPESIELLEEVEMKSTDDTGSVTRFKNQPLDSDEVIMAQEQGKLVQRIGIQFADSFTAIFCEDGSIKRVKFSDRLKEENDDIPSDQVAARIDADSLLNLSALEEFAEFSREYFNLNDE